MTAQSSNINKWCSASVICSLICLNALFLAAVSAEGDASHQSAESHLRTRRQAWLPRIGRRTTLVLPRTGRPEDDISADSFESTIRQALAAIEQQRANDDCGESQYLTRGGYRKRADRNPPSVLMRLGKRSAPCRPAAEKRGTIEEPIEALKKYGIRML